MVTKADLTPEAMARYRRTALAREEARREQAEQRRQVAWDVARQAARLLRESFGATRVVVFGSLAHGAWFHPRSDIDLAAEGIPPEAFWRAGVALEKIDPSFEIDLIAIEAASDRLLIELTRYGVEL